MKITEGFVFKRKGKTGIRYYAGWHYEGKGYTRALRDPNGQPITDKESAQKALEDLMAPFAIKGKVAALESIAGQIAGRKEALASLEEKENPPLPISQAWSSFRASPNRPDSGEETLYQYECQWTRFADWIREKHPDVLTLREVTREVAEEYAASLNHGTVSPNTFNKHVNLLMLVFRVLQRSAKLIENPWLHPKKGGTIARKAVLIQSRRELTIDELRKVCQSATGELRVLLALGVYTGLRLGDCATLRWGEVDLRRGIITRVPNKTARKPGPDGQPKKVLIPIHQILGVMLAEAPLESRADYVLPDTAKLYAYRTDAVTDMIQKHFKKCGIAVWKPGTGPTSPADGETKPAKRAVIEVGFHSLRHTFVSLCRESNAPLAVVESIVGHSNPAMTRHYTHVGELAAGQAVAALPAIIGEAKPEPAKPNLEAILRECAGLAAKITAKTWKAQKAALVNILAPYASAPKS